MLLPIHIAAGGLALVLGAVALTVKKGGTIHRRSGLLFVCAMLVMGTSASILAFRKSPSDPNVFAFFLTGYSINGQYKERSLVSGDLPCNGSSSCISGYFITGQLAPSGGTIGGGPNMGVTIIQIVE